MACVEYVIYATDINGTKCNVFYTYVDKCGRKRVKHTHTHGMQMNHLNDKGESRTAITR